MECSGLTKKEAKLITWWSNWKKDLRLTGTAYWNREGNMSNFKQGWLRLYLIASANLVDCD
jgi:hypothetical protein